MADSFRNRMFFALSTVLMLFLATYVSIRLVFGLDVASWLRALLVLSILISSQSISFMRYIVTIKPHLSFTWLRVGGYVSALFMTLVSFTVLRDGALIVLWLLSSVFGFSLAGSFFVLLNSSLAQMFMLIMSATLAGVGMWSALRVPRIREVELNHPALPPEMDGLRIAHLSDLHIGSTFDGEWLDKVVESTNAMDPDLVLITGDLVDGVPEILGEEMLGLTKLQSRLGVLISVGNHEYYSGVMPWVHLWRDMGLTVLLNEHTAYEISGKALVVTGIADPNASRFPGLVLPDATGAKAGAPKGFQILMAHQPKEAPYHATLGYHLQLSGHTHGGQYFFLFPLVNWMNNGYRSGLYDVNPMKLYVNPGTGLWGYVPMRMGSPSEITILTLRSGYK